MCSSFRGDVGRQDRVITSGWTKSFQFNVRWNVCNLFQQIRVGLNKKFFALTHKNGKKNVFIYISISTSLASKDSASKSASEDQAKLISFLLAGMRKAKCLKTPSTIHFTKLFSFLVQTRFYCTVWLQVGNWFSVKLFFLFLKRFSHENDSRKNMALKAEEQSLVDDENVEDFLLAFAELFRNFF